MVDSAPTLPPREARILESYLDCEDLPTLCARENLSAQDLLAWSAHPAVQAALAMLRSLISFQADYHQSAPRLQAIESLRSLLKDTDNPIERRRAATTLVRMPAFPRRSCALPRGPARVMSPAPRGIGVPADAPRSNTPKNSQPAPAPAHSPPSPRSSAGRGVRGPSEFKPRTERGVPVSVDAPSQPSTPSCPLSPRLPDPTPAHFLRTRAGTTCGPP